MFVKIKLVVIEKKLLKSKSTRYFWQLYGQKDSNYEIYTKLWMICKKRNHKPIIRFKEENKKLLG